MKRLLIIVEGDTEKEFVNNILAPYLFSKGIGNVQCFKIKHSKGGLSKYEHLKKDIINSLYEDNVIVTTLIDFYALPKDFPKYEEAIKFEDKLMCVDFLENAIKEDIENSQQKTFNNLIPYIQLHEFEALVFSSKKGIENLFTPKQANFNEFEKIFNAYTNPEEINNDPNNAPSKRLKLLIKGYNKFVDGIMIIDEIGINTILSKCPRFNNWISLLTKK